MTTNKLYPVVSIITPTFNSAKTLHICIESVANQTYPNVEHWIIDGNSKDQTVNLIKQYAVKYPHIKWLSETDKGIYDAMNKGIEKSKGEWLFFMGSDDKFYNESVLGTFFGDSNIHQNYEVLYGDFIYEKSGERCWGQFNKQKIKYTNMGHQTLFLNRMVFDKVGKFSLKYKMAGDYLHNLMWFGNDSIRRKYIPQIVSIFGEEGFSSQQIDREFLKDMPILIEKHLDIKPSFLDRLRFFYDGNKPTWFRPTMWWFKIKNLTPKKKY